MTTLVLASGSPRRRELLGYLGVPFRVVVTDAEETDTAPPAVLAAIPACPVPTHDHPTLRAWRKADAVAQTEPGIVLGADTIVVLDGAVLNKPHDAKDAQRMLAELAGREHTVYTGLAVLAINQPPRFGLVASIVRIAALTTDQIIAYVHTGEPLDKAGAYGVQGIGGRLVEQVRGSYTCVVGLPLGATAALLEESGIIVPRRAEDAYHTWLKDQGKEPLPCPPSFP